MLDIIIISGKKTARKASANFCLKSVQHNTRSPFRLIIERSDKSASENRNSGMQKATAPYVCFMDDDVWVSNGWDLPLISLLSKNPQLHCVSPLILLENGRIFCAGLIYDQHSFFRPFGYMKPRNFFSNQLFSPDALPTTCLVVKREVLNSGIRFDKKYLQSQWEDVDYYMQLKQHGFNGAVTAGSFVYHCNYFRSDCFHKNFSLFTGKWEPLRAGFTKAAVHREKKYISGLFKKEEDAHAQFLKPCREIKAGIILYHSPFSGKKMYIKYADKKYTLACSCLQKEANILSLLYPAKKERTYFRVNTAHHAGIVFPASTIKQLRSLHREADIRGLAEALAILHSKATAAIQSKTVLPRLYGGSYLFVSGYRRALLRHLASVNTEKSNIEKTENFFSRARNLRQAYYSRFGKPRNFKLLHGDLTESNIFRKDDGQIILIDFEDSCLGPVEADLCKLLARMPLNDQALRFFIHCYCYKINSGARSSEEEVSAIINNIGFLAPVIEAELLLSRLIQQTIIKNTYKELFYKLDAILKKIAHAHTFAGC